MTIDLKDALTGAWLASVPDAAEAGRKSMRLAREGRTVIVTGLPGGPRRYRPGRRTAPHYDLRCQGCSAWRRPHARTGLCSACYHERIRRNNLSI